MKKKILIGGSVLFILVIGILYINGWRLIYSPNMKFNFITINHIGNWVSTAISLIALLISFYIPKKIAKQQNTINLFEKRFDCYCIFQKYYEFGKTIENKKNRSEIIRSFSIWFLNGKDSINNNEIRLCLKKDENIMIAGLFIFSTSNSISKNTIVELLINMSKIVDCDSKENISPEEKKNIEKFNCIIKEHIEEIKKELIIIN